MVLLLGRDALDTGMQQKLEEDSHGEGVPLGCCTQFLPPLLKNDAEVCPFARVGKRMEMERSVLNLGRILDEPGVYFEVKVYARYVLKMRLRYKV